MKTVSYFILREAFHRTPTSGFNPRLCGEALARRGGSFYCDVGSTQVWDLTHWPGSWVPQCPHSPGVSELADYEAALAAGLVIPLAVGVDLHTVFCPTAVVGLPWGPVGVDQGLPCGVGELALGLDVGHAQERSLVLSGDQLSQGLILGCRAWGGQLSPGLRAYLLCILKSFFEASCLEDLLTNTLAIGEERH